MFSSVFENVSLKISLEPRQHIAYPGVGKCPGEINARGIGDHIEDFKITGRRGIHNGMQDLVLNQEALHGRRNADHGSPKHQGDQRKTNTQPQPLVLQVIACQYITS